MTDEERLDTLLVYGTALPVVIFQWFLSTSPTTWWAQWRNFGTPTTTKDRDQADQL